MAEEKDRKLEWLVSLLPSVCFLCGFLFLLHSDLDISRLIAVESDALAIFLKTLMNGDISFALTQSFEYVWSDVLLTAITFLGILCMGFLASLFFMNRINIKLAFLADTFLIILISFLSKLSIPLIFLVTSLLLSDVWIHKTFEMKKNNFSTAYHLVKTRLGIANVFLLVGILLTLLIDSSLYQPRIREFNVELIKNIMPNESQVAEIQKAQIMEITQGIKSALTRHYQQLPESMKTDCGGMYEAMISGIEEYEELAPKHIEEQLLIIDEDKIIESLPFIGIFTKIMPLILVFNVYLVLGVLTPLLSIVSAIVYTILKR